MSSTSWKLRGGVKPDPISTSSMPLQPYLGAGEGGGGNSRISNRRGSGENQAGGPGGGNGIGGPRRKIGRIGGPTVGRGSGGKGKMGIPTVYKSIFMNFMLEFVKNRLNLYLLLFSSENLIYIEFDRGSGKQKSILTGDPGRNTKHVLTRGPSRTNSPPPTRPPCPLMITAQPFSLTFAEWRINEIRHSRATSVPLHLYLDRVYDLI